MGMNIKKTGLVLIMSVLIVALVTSACAPTPVRVKKKEAMIGHHAILSGIGVVHTVPQDEGVFDYIKHINDGGGIDGVTIKVVWRDCQLDPSKYVTAYRRFRDSGVVAQTYTATSAFETLIPQHIRDEIPMVFQGGFFEEIVDIVAGQPAWLFGGYPGYSAEYATFLHWAKQGWTESRPLRVGMVVSHYRSAIALAEEAPMATAAIEGVEWVGFEALPMATIDTSTELLRMQGKGVDWIYIMLAGEPAVLMKDAARLGMHEKGIKFAGMWSMVDESVMKVAGTDAEGWYGIKHFPTNAVDVPGVNVALEAAKRYRGYRTKDVAAHYFCGWIKAAVVVEGVRLAIEKIGPENLSGRAVRDALATMTGFDTGLVPPITITDREPWYTRGMKIFQVRQGKLMPISDWLKPAWLPDYLQKLGPR